MAAAALLALALAASAQDRPRVLIVTGENNHDWEFTSDSLRGMLADSGRFELELTTTPAIALANTEALTRIDAVVLDYNGARWGEAAEKAFLDAVEDGLGVAVVHAADNAFPGWTEYERLVGLLWREGTGHGRFHAFDVTVDDRDHPVTRGLPDLIAHPDELYHRLVDVTGVAPRVLASAFSDPATGGTGAREPMITVGSYGKGRVFHTPLGHAWRGDVASRASHRDPAFRRLIVRGVEWAATGDVTEEPCTPNALTVWEERAGWRLLFDGATTDGWRAFGKAEFPAAGWEVVDGTLHHRVDQESGGDLVTREAFGDFELAFQWRVAPGANSGVKYRFREEDGAPVGAEYQLLDDEAHPDEGRGKTSAAALYDVCAPDAAKRLAPSGAWNHGRIVSAGDRIEQWLNGARVLALEVGSADWNERVAASKFAGRAAWARVVPSPIALQDHGDEVWFRDLRLRDLSRPPGRRVELFDGETLAGWTPYGEAEYSVVDGELIGAATDLARNGFLVTERAFGDFVLELELKLDVPCNSGVQVRSRVGSDGTVVGYQIEVDPSERAWSGGLYDESRRGWLYDLSRDAAARAAFRPGEWNRYRIECIGPTIKSWVNGVPCTRFADAADASGVIALQVHVGPEARMRWRNVVLWELSYGVSHFPPPAAGGGK